MADYVDGFVVPVPKGNVGAYRKLAKRAAKVWIEHGALMVRECLADDVKPGKSTSFPQAVKLKENEVVVFSFIVFRNRRHRDEVNKKVMADPRLAGMVDDPKSLPFDGRRMIYGGFRNIVEA